MSAMTMSGEIGTKKPVDRDNSVSAAATNVREPAKEKKMEKANIKSEFKKR